jgi:hypothetical protein
MFNLDPRIRGIPAHREQVLSFFQSINQPHLAIPGKQAGPAQAYIVGLRSQAGLNSLVYLYLAESNDCAVYTSATRNVGPEQFEELQALALSFVESMGFMMDNMNFTAIELSEQEEMMRSLPVFMRDPSGIKPPARAPSAPSVTSTSSSGSVGTTSKAGVAVALGRIFSAF